MALEPIFLYPKSRQFPFDGTCQQIVCELEARQWNVPGIRVEFDEYGKYRLVRHIRGDDFKLWFCRIQGYLGSDWNDTAAVTEIVIPRKELHVYDDESGPTFYLYVGRRWRRDSREFMNGSKVNSKRNGERRTYLMYTGQCRCGAVADVLKGVPHTHAGRRPPLLVHDNDLGREYEPRRKEPREFSTANVFAEFDQWLKAELLARILAHPVAA